MVGKNSSNDFSHVRMSSPNKEEAKVPDFNPPLEKEILKDRGPILTNLLGVNHKTRADAKSDSGISSPQIAQKVVQNVRVNSRHCSGIDSPKVIQNEIISSVPSVTSVPLVPSVPLVTSVPSVPSTQNE